MAENVKNDDASTRRAKLFAIIRELKIGMLTTLRHDGSLHVRPMVTRLEHEGGPLWFFTAEQAPKSGEVDADRHVAVAYADPGRQLFAAVSGTARVLRDRARMEALWSPTLVTWFPKGLDDPDLALLRVDATIGEYWDAPSSTMVEIIAAVQSGLDNPPAVDVGDHAKVRLKLGR